MNNEKNIILLLLLIISISLTDSVFSLPVAKGFLQDPESLKESIIALDITRTKTQQYLSQLRLKQNMSLSKEIREYTVFIEYLSFQIINYCQQLVEQKDYQAISGLPCAVQNNFSEGAGTMVQDKPVTTAEEQLGSLENELLNSLGEFDEMLLKEEEHIAQVNRKALGKNQSNQGKSSQAAKGGSSTAQHQEEQGTDEFQESEKQSQTKPTQSDSGKKQKSKNMGSVRGKQKSSAKNQSRERRKLDEIDDDIVARQLKEAAEKETDPQLKEKLWDEYYRYKKSTVRQ